jgi:hypothetical protein
MGVNRELLAERKLDDRLVLPAPRKRREAAESGDEEGGKVHRGPDSGRAHREDEA